MPTYSGRIVEGKLVLADYVKAKMSADIKELDGKCVEIVIKKLPRRSLPQNGYYWGVVVEMVKDGLIALGHKVDADHIALCEGYTGIKSMVVLSGYMNEIYSDLLKDWHTYHIDAHADGARDRVETLWLNQAAYEALVKSKNVLF